MRPALLLPPNLPYGGDRLALCWDPVPAVNAELKALAAGGAGPIGST